MTNDDGLPRFELPDRGTLVALGFLLLLGFGLVTIVVPGFDQRPQPSADAAPVFARVQGTVVFGTALSGDCAVTDSADRFTPGTEVWWTAWLTYALEADAEALLVVRRDGIEIGRGPVGKEEGSKAIAVLCSEMPIGESTAGTYRVEVRDVSDRVTYAVGEYQVTATAAVPH